MRALLRLQASIPIEALILTRRLSAIQDLAFLHISLIRSSYVDPAVSRVMVRPAVVQFRRTAFIRWLDCMNYSGGFRGGRVGSGGGSLAELVRSQCGSALSGLRSLAKA
ncbi:hypothetical protein PF008_g13053 [Phytophthora fragariae]|uniref:Uncharacterized protein n=1 Tax=Phytophthora fragariae TaxID=53985 RepID=A0A6G0RL20_9STRA|nr:hypothetical protein PF008_g13053 [Phytophthora fragariae]